MADVLWLSFYAATYASIVLHARDRVRSAPSSLWLDGAIVGMVVAAWAVGLVCFALGAISLAGLEDTHGRDLDFVE